MGIGVVGVTLGTSAGANNTGKRKQDEGSSNQGFKKEINKAVGVGEIATGIAAIGAISGEGSSSLGIPTAVFALLTSDTNTPPIPLEKVVDLYENNK